MDKSIVNEVVSALEAVKSYGQPGFWILLSILIVLVLKKQDEGLRKRELEVKERKQRQVLNRSQRALKGSVSHTMLRPDFKGMTSAVPDSSKADLQRKPDEGVEAGGLGRH